MEARFGGRLLWLAALSGVLCVDTVLGKYVKGVVDTKEVTATAPNYTASLRAMRCYQLEIQASAKAEEDTFNKMQNCIKNVHETPLE